MLRPDTKQYSLNQHFFVRFGLVSDSRLRLGYQSFRHSFKQIRIPNCAIIIANFHPGLIGVRLAAHQSRSLWFLVGPAGFLRSRHSLSFRESRPQTRFPLFGRPGLTVYVYTVGYLKGGVFHLV